MSSGVSGGVIQRGKLLIHIAENGHSFELDCDEYTLVEAVQRCIESLVGIKANDQLLLCLDMILESQQPLSAYKLPSDDCEVYLFNKARMRRNSPPPDAEQIDIVDSPDPPPPSSSHDPHPLDDASDPALKALPSYERQFRYHYQRGEAIYCRSLAKYEACMRLSREQKVQEKALDIARGKLNHLYKMTLQNYGDFTKCYSQQHRVHTNLLVNFGRDIERLRSCKIIPALQSSNRKCLLDFVKEENLRKTVEDCGNSHRQFENKVEEFKQEFGELKRSVEHLFSSKASILHRDLERTIKDHYHQYINEQKSIMQVLSKNVGMVKKLVDDCLTSQFSSSLRPHDAVSALGPMYECHDKSYLPKMQECERAITNLFVFCENKKIEMNSFVHSCMQEVAIIQYNIKELRYKFPVFSEALNHQDDQFKHLKVVRGIGPAYRACLAEIVRRKASMKLYMGIAGQLAERLAAEREDEVRRRDEFLKMHSSCIPRDILASMGLYDTPNPCDVNITPFDGNLLDIDISDVDRYAPEQLLGLSLKSEKHNSLKGSISISNESSQSAEVGEISVDTTERYNSEHILDASELLEIAGTSKMEVENTKLKAKLASALALLCSLSPEVEYESLDSEVDNVLKAAAEKTAEALRLKDEYGEHLESMLKSKQMQCESYEKRIRELEQRLSDQYSLEHKLQKDESSFALSTIKAGDSKSEISADGEAHMPYMSSEPMDEFYCASTSLHSKSIGALDKHGKDREGLGDNMTDSSGMLNPQLDSSMLESNREEVHVNENDGKETQLADEGMALAGSSTALLSDTLHDQGMDGTSGDDLVVSLRCLLAEKSSQLGELETKLESTMEEILKLRGELEISQKLLDESQMNCAHLENCLHEAREEAQTHLCAADRRASEYSAMRASAVKMRSLFERLKNCVSSGSVASFAESLRALSQSLSNSTNDSGDDGTTEFRECVKVLAEKVGVLARHRGELLERYNKAEAAKEQLTKMLEEKKELVNTLYAKHQLEKQAKKEKISFNRLEVHELAAFVLNSVGHYEAINRNCTHYYLSAESVAVFADHLPRRPTYIIGQIVHIERQTARSPPLISAQAEHSKGDCVDMLTTDIGTSQLTLNSGSIANPYGLPVGCEYFVVTVAMLPDTTIHSPPPS